MILGAGHYKQTQWYFIISACINLILSFILVQLLGMIGVAIGTFIALLFQSGWMIWYNTFKLKIRELRKMLRFF